jgi:hypothetical protein
MSDVDERAERLCEAVDVVIGRILQAQADVTRATPIASDFCAAIVEELGITSEDVDLLRGEATMRGFMAMEDDESPLDRKKQAALNTLADALDVLLRAARPTSDAEPPTP